MHSRSEMKYIATQKLNDEIMRLKKENGWLRNALEQCGYMDRTRGYPTPREWDAIVEIARKALEEK